MKAGGIGDGAKRMSELAQRYAQSKGQDLKEGLASMKEKAGEKAYSARLDASFAMHNPGFVAKSKAARIKSVIITFGQSAIFLAREPKVRSTIPDGLPKPSIGGKLGRRGNKEPVGPNYFDSLAPEDRKGKSPNYPVTYSIPAEYKNGGFQATGRMAGFSTGPGLLPQEYCIPGRFDYDQIPNLVVTPNRHRDVAQADANPRGTLMGEGSTVLTRYGRNGLPANPETGYPKIPDLPPGSYTLTEQTPGHLSSRAATEKSAGARAPKDPYGLDAIDAM